MSATSPSSSRCMSAEFTFKKVQVSMKLLSWWEYDLSGRAIIRQLSCHCFAPQTQSFSMKVNCFCIFSSGSCDSLLFNCFLPLLGFTGLLLFIIGSKRHQIKRVHGTQKASQGASCIEHHIYQVNPCLCHLDTLPLAKVLKQKQEILRAWRAKHESSHATCGRNTCRHAQEGCALLTLLFQFQYLFITV